MNHASTDDLPASLPGMRGHVSHFAFWRNARKYPVTRVLTWVSGIISLVIVIAIPAAYFFTADHYELNRLQYESDVIADAVSQYAVIDSKKWSTNELHLRDLLSQRIFSDDSTDNHRAFDSTGRLRAEVGARPTPPVISRSAPIHDGYKVVGQIRVTDTLQPILVRTSLVTILALLMAGGVFLILRLLPMRALMRTVAELEEAKQKLRLEVGEKETALKKAEEIGTAMTHQALHDALTKLPNRELFNDRLKQAISLAAHEKAMIAVIIIDLNRFKEVNDKLGHQAGDLVLCEVSSRLQELLRKSDVVARMGGDEFAIMLSTLSSRVEASIVADKIREELRLPLMISTNAVDIDASLGIALFPENGMDNETLLHCADIAMYMAKRNKGGIAYYNPDYDRERKERQALLHDLRGALARDDQLVLHYQPKIKVKSGECHGVEGLARWQHPQRGMLFPDAFIPLIEEAGMTAQLTHYVLNQALRQLRAWRDNGLKPGFKVAINISAADLQESTFADDVAAALRGSENSANFLEFEITETAFMENPVRAVQTISRLRDLGITISIDDFGTGYSSMVHLRRLPVSAIKIDKSFVSDMLVDTNDNTIVCSIIALGHNLGLEVVAEGVEDQSTFDTLKLLGCDFAQGYYFSRPVPAADLAPWLHLPCGTRGSTPDKAQDRR